VAVAVYLIPQVWSQFVSPVLQPLGKFVDVAIRLVVQLAAAGAIIWFGTRLAGDDPPRGLRGGIFLAVSAFFTIFFVTRAVGMNFEDSGIGLPVTLVVLGALLAGTYFFLTSPRAERWMYSLEDQGWFDTHSYKKSQGVRMRRYTLIGILLIGWTGVWVLNQHESLGTGDWRLRIPFTGEPSFVLSPLSEIQYSVPVLVAVLTFWVAWRTVNMPVFADFLIATEAEMNKVSWSTRRRLVQDTIVVLTTVFLLTVFLLVVDLFWGWLLSRDLVGVLPPRSTTAAPVDPTQGKKVDW
jgi:preprotein translocase SecE subunit